MQDGFPKQGARLSDRLTAKQKEWVRERARTKHCRWTCAGRLDVCPMLHAKDNDCDKAARRLAAQLDEEERAEKAAGMVAFGGDTTNIRPLAGLFDDIWRRRAEIKDEFCRAYLAANMPDGATPEWCINNFVLVEQWSEDRLRVTWWFEPKSVADAREGSPQCR